MPLRNQNRYDLNEATPWPISDEASALDDNGVFLPSELLADLHLSYPLAAGRRAYIGAVTVTANLATVVIMATDSVASPGSLVPLAAVSLPQPVDIHRQYALEALYPGTYGWIVFGQGTSRAVASGDMYSGRFTDPVQSVIAPSAARAYSAPPITGVGKLGNATLLTGLVHLEAGNDIEIVKECRAVPSYPPPTGKDDCNVNIPVLREVIVIRLRETVPIGSAGAGQLNVYDHYRGPCSGRPESGTCGEPAPIEMLASVQPDCCGNIDIIVRGCARISAVTEEATLDEDDDITDILDACGVIIDCGLGLSESCVTTDRLPAADGTLPSEVEDLCESQVSISVSVGDIDTSSEFIVSDTFSGAGDLSTHLTDGDAHFGELAGNNLAWVGPTTDYVIAGSLLTYVGAGDLAGVTVAYGGEDVDAKLTLVYDGASTADASILLRHDGDDTGLRVTVEFTPTTTKVLLEQMTDGVVVGLIDTGDLAASAAGTYVLWARDDLATLRGGIDGVVATSVVTADFVGNARAGLILSSNIAADKFVVADRNTFNFFDPDAATPDPSLPYSNDFSTEDADVIVAQGLFVYQNIPPKVWSTNTTTAVALRNISLYDDDFDPLYKRLTARARLLTAPIGSLHNASVIANYRETTPGSGRYQFYLAEIDWDGFYQGYKLFRIARYNGSTFSTLLAYPVPELSLNELYEISLDIVGDLEDDDRAWLTARLVGLGSSGIDLTISDLSVQDFAPTIGKFGMMANRAATRFEQFTIENL